MGTIDSPVVRHFHGISRTIPQAKLLSRIGNELLEGPKSRYELERCGQMEEVESAIRLFQVRHTSLHNYSFVEHLRSLLEERWADLYRFAFPAALVRVVLFPRADAPAR